MDFEEKVISNQNLYDGAILKLDLETVSLPDGRQAKREIVRHQGAVGIIAITPANKIVLIRQLASKFQKS